jgi:hypothetical protein
VLRRSDRQFPGGCEVEWFEVDRHRPPGTPAPRHAPLEQGVRGLLAVGDDDQQIGDRRRQVEQHVERPVIGDVGVVEHEERSAATAARPQELPERSHHLVA